MYRNGNKVAIVTGTSRGVGAAMASRLGTDGRRTRCARRDGAAIAANGLPPTIVAATSASLSPASATDA
jgi:NAD(P)-dependent dehydrogenase (short-subunit alcohol dehydrogenase family)